MDIDVDILGLDGEVDKVRHLIAFGYESLVSRHNSLMKIRMLHITSVNEEELACALLACRLWLAHVAINLAHRGIDVERKEMLVYFLAKDIHYALAQGTRL